MPLHRDAHLAQREGELLAARRPPALAPGGAGVPGDHLGAQDDRTLERVARGDEAVAALESALRARADRRTERTIPTKAPTSGPRIRRVMSMVVATAPSAPDCGSAIARVRASEAWARAPSAGVIVMHQG